MPQIKFNNLYRIHILYVKEYQIRETYVPFYKRFNSKVDSI